MPEPSDRTNDDDGSLDGGPDAGREAASEIGSGAIPIEPAQRSSPMGASAEPSRAAKPGIPFDPSRRASIRKPSLLDDASAGLDRCPGCGSPMPDPNAVVCVACGYDLASNRPMRTKIGETVIPGPDDVDAGALCRADKFGWRLPLIIGAAALVSAATLAGVHGAPAWLRPVLKVLLYGPIQIGLGVVAAIVTARLLQEKVGRLELALGRMALAVGLAYLMFHLGQGVGLPPWAQWGAGAALGAGIYYLIVWLLFSVTPHIALMLGCAHFVMWLAFRLVIFAVNWLESAPAAAAAPAG